MIPILRYNELDSRPVQKLFDKVLEQLQKGDFKSADVKKMPQQGFYRARLDITHRLLFKWTQYQGKKYLLLLEVILNHAYERSRFLNGAKIDEAKLEPLDKAEDLEYPEALVYLNPQTTRFHLLDKVLSFDEVQEAVLQHPLPQILIGSAGSGKTALGLEKLRSLPGKVLYTSRSRYLIDNARLLYNAFDYDNSNQEVDFMAFDDLLFRIEMPEGRGLDYRGFKAWYERHRQVYKFQDPHQLFEEFRGVLTGADPQVPYLSQAAYLDLGARQSIFSPAERERVYALFLKYLDFLKTERYFDQNILAHAYRARVQAEYDYLFVDEVQDLTVVQLDFILAHLKKAEQFILCGDANQIVHPNFFSWAQVKTLFFRKGLQDKVLTVLSGNYRNSPEVTELANRLLKVKHLRFGSVDKESQYLVRSNRQDGGTVQLLAHKPKILQDLDQKTRRSAKVAVLVLREEDKAAARQWFKTPLVFSVQEAKGLEYERVILYNLISGQHQNFEVLCEGIRREDVEALAELQYSRAKDKQDKSLDIYKFYVNALYVALTRAIRDIWIIEQRQNHELLELLALREAQNLQAQTETSNQDDWLREAQRLEKQGKAEQAEAIRREVLQIQPVPWEIIHRDNYPELLAQALDPVKFNKKQKDKILDYWLFYGCPLHVLSLEQLKYAPASRWRVEQQGIWRRGLADYVQDKPAGAWLQKLQRYGLDYRNEWNLTPLMAALSSGAVLMAEHLLQQGAKTDLQDNFGFEALDLLLLRAYLDPKLLPLLEQFYPRLAKTPLRFRLHKKLIILEPRHGEYFWLRWMLASSRLKYYRANSELFLQDAEPESAAYNPSDLTEFAEKLSTRVLPEYRQKRSYINALLSRNEVEGNSPYNRKLFVRLLRGWYILNPALELEHPDKLGEWLNLYELQHLEEVRICPSLPEGEDNMLNIVHTLSMAKV